MICKDTLMMIAGGLLAGYGAVRAMGEKNAFKKFDVVGPLIGGGAILGFGYMNYRKNKMPPAQPPVPNVKGMGGAAAVDNTPKPVTSASLPPLFGDEGYDVYSLSPQGLIQGAVPTVLSKNKPMNVWANYTEQNTLNTSGNASSLYDYNHIYPGII